MDADGIKAYIDAHREDMIEDLRPLIAIPSVTEDRENVKKALRYVLRLAGQMGFHAESVLDQRVGVISCGEGTETVGILAHVDVVPCGEENAWKTPPFQMTEKDGRLYGRGTLDDKGAVIACLYAMKYLLECGKPIRKKVQLILGTQEEVEWSDMEAYVKAYPLPDYGFTPDGEFPLCNIEKGIMAVSMEFPLDEPGPNGWYVCDVKAGQAVNTVPGKCAALLRYFVDGAVVEERDVEALGKSVHSCQPEKGKNAVFAMADALEKQGLRENRIWYLLKNLKTAFEDIYGRSLGLYSENEYYNGEFVHRNVFSPNLVRVENGLMKVSIDVRFAYGSDENHILERLRQFAENLGGSLLTDMVQPAVYVSRDRPFMKAFGEAYEEGCGREHQFMLAYGGSYAKAMPNIVSWGPIFPGEEDTCHQENEYISVDTLLDNSKIFAIALAKVVLSPKSFK